MTAIDAAIIKALVEHIGMNPDDVPVQGGDIEDPAVIFDTTKYTKIENGVIDTENYAIMNDQKQLKVGDIMVVKFDSAIYPNIDPICAIVTYVSSSDIVVTSKNEKTGNVNSTKFKYDTDKLAFITTEISTNNGFAALDGTTGFFSTDLTSSSPIVEKYIRESILERIADLEYTVAWLKSKPT